jgi:hypothetical protein
MKEERNMYSVLMRKSHRRGPTVLGQGTVFSFFEDSNDICGKFI